MEVNNKKSPKIDWDKLRHGVMADIVFYQINSGLYPPSEMDMENSVEKCADWIRYANKYIDELINEFK